MSASEGERGPVRSASGATPIGNRHPLRRAFTWGVGIAVALVVALLGYVAFEYVSLDRGLRRSGVLDDRGGSGGGGSDSNLLVMGLDSRLDLRGNPLPEHMYKAMHTGNSTIGGMNANVLMYVHIPSDGSAATVIQIPRDNFVVFPGCPGGRCDGKIKEAYDKAYEAEQARLAPDSTRSEEEKHTLAREAGRAEQIETVEAFLGNGIRINHFVEVTMVAFYQLAQVVQPITVCLKNDTRDRFSGADFAAGRQEISAEQAVAFVRQRRDELVASPDFTDLDRERRQQAFIASLAHQLRQKGTFANPRTLNDLVGVAKENIAVDADLDLLTLAQQASSLSNGNVTFYTLPIKGYFTDKYGGASNEVDLPVLQATVRELLSQPREPSPTTSAAPKPAAFVVNGSGVDGAANLLLNGLSAAGYPRGEATTAPALRPRTVVAYPPGQEGPGAELAAMLGPGVTSVEDPAVPAGTLQVTLGQGYQIPASLGGAPAPADTPGGTATATVPAAPLTPTKVGQGGSDEDTSSSTLTALSGGGIPCVK